MRKSTNTRFAGLAMATALAVAACGGGEDEAPVATDVEQTAPAGEPAARPPAGRAVPGDCGTTFRPVPC